MKLYIFGAGASLAAQDGAVYPDGHAEKAPLVDALFNEQYKGAYIDGLNFDISECRKKVEEGKPLETWLSEKWLAIDLLKTDRAKRSERSWFGHVNLYIWNLLNNISKTYPNAQGYTYLLSKILMKTSE